jgi:hypothetical protein
VRVLEMRERDKRRLMNQALRRIQGYERAMRNDLALVLELGADDEDVVCECRKLLELLG